MIPRPYAGSKPLVETPQSGSIAKRGRARITSKHYRGSTMTHTSEEINALIERLRAARAALAANGDSNG